MNQRDHPRSRGKDVESIAEVTSVPGSPPLARERQFADFEVTEEPGITPARAGKTDRPASTGQGDLDHPRSRGKDQGRAGPPED